MLSGGTAPCSTEQQTARQYETDNVASRGGGVNRGRQVGTIRSVVEWMPQITVRIVPHL